MVIDNTYLKVLENIINVSHPPVIMLKAQFPGRILPPDNRWGLFPKAGNIGTLNFVLEMTFIKKVTGQNRK